MTFREILRKTQELLSGNVALSARGSSASEAEQIVAAAHRAATSQRLSRLELYSKAGDPFPPEAEEQALRWAESRAAGSLLQHLIGYQVFLDHEYRVGPEVLIPRPETETLVVHAREILGKEPALRDVGIEIGLGSGIISIELLARFPELRMRASELSRAAAELARLNAREILGARAAERLEIRFPENELEVIEPFLSEQPKAGFLISNPPYLVPGTEVEEEVRLQEPAAALFAPDFDPLYFYREIAARGREVLRAGGLVFLEIAHERSRETLNLFESSGWDARLLLDLNGRPRILSGRMGK